ncbi:MAG: DEAD/DEAH box helicase, partial [Sciscionella sp.]
MVFWDVAGDAPDGVTVVLPGDAGVRQRVAPALRLPVGDAVPLLATNRSGAHPATEFWGAATALALRLLARGRLLPGVSPDGFDAWRVGPLDPADVERIRLLAAAMPPEARAAPLPGHASPTLAEPLTLLRGFLDAVADTLPRTPAAARMTGMAPFADARPQRVPQLRGWADELDPGTRVSLRVELDTPGGSFRVVLQVHDDSAMVTDAAELWTDGARSGAQLKVTLAVRRAARVWPVLERLLEHPVPDRLALGDDEVQELISAASRLNAAGVAVHWPAELARELTARAVVGGGNAPPAGPRGFLSGDQLCTVDWQLALHGQPLTEAELDELARAHRPLVRLREEWVLLDQELARKARERELKPLAPIDALGAALSGIAEVDGEPAEVVSSGWLETLRQRVTDESRDTGPDTQPAALAATLRDYQLRGLRWLARMTSLGLGGCLADDMGLGKTITLIALHLHRKSEMDSVGSTLVVCPASLLGNWEREIRRFAPGTPVRRFHGTHRSLDLSLDGTDDGFVLTTYGTMRVDAARLAERHWGLLVADEAQHVKNPLSSTARALRTIPSDARVALTGTPVENDLTELWAILDWTTPGLLGTRSTFRRRWAQPIQSERD